MGSYSPRGFESYHHYGAGRTVFIWDTVLFSFFIGLFLALRRDQVFFLSSIYFDFDVYCFGFLGMGVACIDKMDDYTVHFDDSCTMNFLPLGVTFTGIGD